jgi:hypothetical protein
LQLLLELQQKVAAQQQQRLAQGHHRQQQKKMSEANQRQCRTFLRKQLLQRWQLQ